MAADDLPARASHVAGAVRVNGQRPAHLVEHHVMMPVAVILEVREAGVAAVGAVLDVVGFAPGRGLVTAAGVLARLGAT